MKDTLSFFKGAALGLLVGLMITSTVVYSAFSYGFVKFVVGEDKNNSYNNNNTESDFIKKVEAKVKYAKKLLDMYYLDEYDENTLVDGVMSGMMDSVGDVYTTYYTKEEFNALLEDTAGVFYGIGVVVTQDPKTKIVKVVNPTVGGPGYEAGILADDVLYSVDDKVIDGMDINNVVAMIHGEEGTYVKIGVIRQGHSEPIVYEIERRKIESDTVAGKMLEDNIGYVKITGFEEITPSQFERTMEELKSSNMQRLIIDLRDNPGGSLTSVMEIMDMMLPKGLYTYFEDKDGKRENYTGSKDAIYEYPTVILTNGNTASAAELFTGAMSDYKKATVVGTTSFGKGIVQQIYSLTDGTGIKLTMAKYYTPNGVCIHKIGIKPDIEVSLDEGEYASTVTFEEDNQLQKAIEIVKSKS